MEYNDYNTISRLIIKYIKGELSSQERDELSEWRATSDRNEELFQRLISSDEFNLKVSKYIKSVYASEKSWENLRELTIKKEKQISIHKLLRYAAIFIGPIIIASLFILTDFDFIHRDKVNPKIVAGSSVATLILPNGEKLLLGENIPNKMIYSYGIVANKDTLKYKNTNKSYISKKEAIVYHTIRVPKKGEYNLRLSDGSTVFLNSESELRYPAQFSGDSRKVYLKGEAFFNVKKDTKHPFIVDLKEMKVRVLGTSFGVRAYEDEEKILTTLVTGKVQVNIPSSGISSFLEPYYQACLFRKTKKLMCKKVDVEQYVGWKDGRLIFDNTPLDKILRVLSRWYDFEVFYMNKDLKEVPFSVNIKKYNDFDDVLNLFEKTGIVKFRIKGNAVIVE